LDLVEIRLLARRALFLDVNLSGNITIATS
jgi:hypothetical protein